MVDEIREIPLYHIRINPYQPRRHFDESELQDLAKSLKAIGFIHPPLVRPLPEEGEYELIAGERRLRAAYIAGFEKIPVIIRASDTLQSAEAALMENLQRCDLNPIETARAIRSLLIDFDLTQEELSERIGKKRSTIANYVRLMSLSPPIQESVANGKLTMGHAKVLLSLPSDEEQIELHNQIIAKELTVRQTEFQIKNKLKTNLLKKTLSRQQYAPEIDDMRTRLQNYLATKVQFLWDGEEKGRIQIDFYGLQDLNRLLELMLNAKEESAFS